VEGHNFRGSLRSREPKIGQKWWCTLQNNGWRADYFLIAHPAEIGRRKIACRRSNQTIICPTINHSLVSQKLLRHNKRKSARGQSPSANAKLSRQKNVLITTRRALNISLKHIKLMMAAAL
jgi:hypothetical protein